MRSFRDLFPSLLGPDEVEQEHETLLRELALPHDSATHQRLVERWQRMLAAEEALSTPPDGPAKFCTRCFAELPCACAPVTEPTPTPSEQAKQIAGDSKYKRGKRRR